METPKFSNCLVFAVQPPTQVSARQWMAANNMGGQLLPLSIQDCTQEDFGEHEEAAEAETVERGVDVSDLESASGGDNTDEDQPLSQQDEEVHEETQPLPPELAEQYFDSLPDPEGHRAEENSLWMSLSMTAAEPEEEQLMREEHLSYQTKANT